ncbi:heparinase II/III family protein [Paenibacillus allorhizosphaerae]|uniref:Heparinase n=1 Tax=Paenibacillus allorhizosphaerae TaxID=2849866 RepID=A0ABN7TK74_9BACL|nr:heparinase II/III family protein [Paenibacillus allorhizosphaerae]CAG7642668.1 hypothetical protein PAECIP111802_02887 [Paenibacillus allorhizosphaerae]
MNIQQKTACYSWAQESLRRLQAALEPLLSEETHIPEEPGGWWHQYVCPEHHTELVFDERESDATRYRCPKGCTLTGEPYRGAWLVVKHQSLVRLALQAAAVYAGTGETRYAAWSASVLHRYALQYPRFPVHPDAEPWMLKGRAFHQALTEAIWATTFIRAYLLLADHGYAPEKGDAAFQTFFKLLGDNMRSARQVLVVDRKSPESNYTAWLNAALASVYAATGDRERMAELVQDGEAGYIRHLTIGVKPDQLEYEGTLYYHIFVLRAYWITAEMALRQGIDLAGLHGAQGQSLRGMLDAAALLADDSGFLPALHDGPYRRGPYAREIVEVYEAGMSRFGNKEYEQVLSEAYRQLNGAPVRTGLEALLYGEGDWGGPVTSTARPSVLFKESGLAVGRGRGSLSFCTDFGSHGGSHGHYDKLHISLECDGVQIAPDMGMVPYGSAMRKEWYAATASHNTVLIGGLSQRAHEGECVRFEEAEGRTYCQLRTTGAYDGCEMERHLLLTDGLLFDWFQVKLTEANTIDWWMHSRHLDPQEGGSWTAEEGSFSDSGPYAYVNRKSVFSGETGELCHTLMRGEPGGAVAMSTLLFPASQLRLTCVPGTAEDPSIPYAGLLHRQTGDRADFITVYRAGSQHADLIWLGSDAAGKQAVQVNAGDVSWVYTLHSAADGGALSVNFMPR